MIIASDQVSDDGSDQTVTPDGEEPTSDGNTDYNDSIHKQSPPETKSTHKLESPEVHPSHDDR